MAKMRIIVPFWWPRTQTEGRTVRTNTIAFTDHQSPPLFPPCFSLSDMGNPVLHAKLTRMVSQAIDRLCEGSVEEGETLLSSCLSLGLQEVKKVQCTADHPKQQGKQPPSLLTVPLEGVFVDEGFPVDLPHSWFCLYRFAFGMRSATEQDLSAIIAVSAYNLAMIHHEIGLFDNNFQRLVKARRYYELALQHMTTPSPLFKLATYNNMGHLSSFFGDTEGIQLCRNALERGKLFAPGFHPAFNASLDRVRRFSAPLAPAA